MRRDEDTAEGSPAEPAIAFRPAGAADAEALARLWTGVYVPSGITGRTESFTAEEAGRALTASDGRVAVDAQGAVLGAVLLAPQGVPAANLTRSSGEAQILLLAVDDPARRAGLGRSLVGWCLETARARGLETLWLWSRPTQQPAHRLYESCGFVRAFERDRAPGGPERLVYRLEL